MNVVRKYLVLTLSMLITLSASGLSISVHECCGKIRDFSLFGDLPSCKMHQVEVRPGCDTLHRHTPGKKGKPCCSEQKIVVGKTSDAIAKSQIKEVKSFDVLFVLTFVKNWLGFSSESSEEDEVSSSGSFSFIESLVILFRQFRI